MNVLLTIAIPTYNRALKLKAQLDCLLPQLTAETICCIYDNASTDSTRGVAEKSDSDYFRYVRAPFNGGAGRNFLRCFEECQTEWLWILSDDDPISASAVADLLRIIRDCKADFIHTSTPCHQHPVDAMINDVSQLLQHASAGSVLWISTGVYRSPSFRPLLRFFTESISTWGPQMVLVLALLEKQAGKGFVTSISLITQFPDPIPRWSTLDFINRFIQLPEYLKNSRDQALLAQSISNDFYYLTLLLGLREVDTPAKATRWQRIRKLAKIQLRSYGARSPVLDIILKKEWYRTGRRRTSFLALHHALLLIILSCCPAGLFLPVLRCLPKPGWLRRVLHQTQGKAMESG